ncbi:MAG: hypothetical protein WD073_09930 [Xanthobacteraceae bacterium]
MKRYAVGSDFEGTLRFFTGAAACTPARFAASVSDRAGEAFVVSDRHRAKAIVTGLTEMGLGMNCHACEARTWFVVELPAGRPS